MPSPSRETVVLVLKNVVYRHSEFKSLEEFLVERYGFGKIEEKKCAISELRTIKHEGAASEEEIERKFDSYKIFEGNYLDSRIKICIMGGITEDEDFITGIGEKEQYTVYTTAYQMIKFVADSGYAIQQLIERLTTDLGLDTKPQEWTFHRSREA